MEQDHEMLGYLSGELAETQENRHLAVARGDAVERQRCDAYITKITADMQRTRAKLRLRGMTIA